MAIGTVQRPRGRQEPAALPERPPAQSPPGTTVSLHAPAEPPPMTEGAASVLCILVRRAAALGAHDLDAV